MTHNILVATTNAGKLAELSQMLDDLSSDIRWLSLRDYPGVSEVVEDGQTFTENARKKALGYAAATGLWTLADDSGLVIDALNGAPGVYSARFAADESSSTDRRTLDVANYEKVLRLLKDTPPAQRTARFVCHLTLATPDRVLIEADGTVEGVITEAPSGTNGFGYDPVFYIPSLGRTVAQLEDEQKNQVSHRGSAIRHLKPLLLNFLRNS
jgi:XTP/dITP diphosphohydrolase